MAHIAVPDGLPGIRGLMAFRPETAGALNELAEVLLRADNSLSRGERELIAAYVSGRNECEYCNRSHRTFAAAQLDGGWDVVEGVERDLASAPITPKLRALLAVAGEVQQGGRAVQAETVAAARAEGATDVELHDTVLIAAAFCMFNRYVDGLGTTAASDQSFYDASIPMIVGRGYRAVGQMLADGTAPRDPALE